MKTATWVEMRTHTPSELGWYWVACCGYDLSSEPCYWNGSEFVDWPEELQRSSVFYSPPLEMPAGPRGEHVEDSSSVAWTVQRKPPAGS